MLVTTYRYVSTSLCPDKPADIPLCSICRVWVYRGCVPISKPIYVFPSCHVVDLAADNLSCVQSLWVPSSRDHYSCRYTSVSTCNYGGSKHGESVPVLVSSEHQRLITASPSGLLVVRYLIEPEHLNHIIIVQSLLPVYLNQVRLIHSLFFKVNMDCYLGTCCNIACFVVVEYWSIQGRVWTEVFQLCRLYLGQSYLDRTDGYPFHGKDYFY